MVMQRVLILGSGAIGSQLGVILHQSGWHVDCSDPFFPELPFKGDVLFEPHLVADYDYVINTAPIHEPERLAGLLVACVQHQTHYLDTNEDLQVGNFVKLIGSTQKDVLFAPHCGLAPGLINILGASFVRQGKLAELDLRVGALTRLVDNKYRYTPTWSPEGLVNQYLNNFSHVDWYQPSCCPSVFMPEQQINFDRFHHEFFIDGVQYECFPTSGGLGTMTEMLELPGSLMYRSIRLPGHAVRLRNLFEKEKYDRAQLVAQMKRHRVSKADDFVYVIAIARGAAPGYTSVTLRADAKTPYMGHSMTAIQKCTIGSVAAVLDMHSQGRLPSGFLHQHEIDWIEFRTSPFVSAIAFEESY